ncbi:MAG TPA: hypothetical protein VEX60_16250, partial [Pyrinomonadaceae bacterium]|nr:hypothetical protein [Pyrinomonadaceae bacterium]
MKTNRFILALIILLAPTAGATAQVVRPAPTPSAPATTSVSPFPFDGDGNLLSDDLLPQTEDPTLGHQGVLVETLDGQIV